MSHPIMVEPKPSIEINLDLIEKEKAEKKAQIKQTQQILYSFIPLSTPAPYELSAHEDDSITAEEPVELEPPAFRPEELKQISQQFKPNWAKLFLGLFLFILFLISTFIVNRSNLSLFIDDPFAAIDKAFNPEINQEEEALVVKETKIVKSQQMGDLKILEEYKVESIKIESKTYNLVTLIVQNDSNQAKSQIRIKLRFNGSKKADELYIHPVPSSLIKRDQAWLNQMAQPSHEHLEIGMKAKFQAIVEGKSNYKKIDELRIFFYQ